MLVLRAAKPRCSWAFAVRLCVQAAMAVQAVVQAVVGVLVLRTGIHRRDQGRDGPRWRAGLGHDRRGQKPAAPRGQKYASARCRPAPAVHGMSNFAIQKQVASSIDARREMQ